MKTRQTDRPTPKTKRAPRGNGLAWAISLALVLALHLGLALSSGCSGVPGGQVQIDWSTAVKMGGDVQCKGNGWVELLDLIRMKVDGGSFARGELDLDGDGAGDACAGVRLSISQFVWSWTSKEQADPACDVSAGELELDPVGERD